MNFTKYFYTKEGQYNSEDEEVLKTLNDFDKAISPIVDKMYDKITKENYDRIHLENFIKERISYNLMYKFLENKGKKK